MDVAKVVGEFLSYHQLNNTADTYRFYKTALRWFLGGFGDCAWESLQERREDVAAGLHQANLRPDGTPWKPDTIRRNKLAFQQLQKFAMDQHDLTPILRPRDLKKPAGNQREDIPTEDELATLFAAADDATELAFRSLAQSGMRPGELCNAKIEDLSAAKDVLILSQHKTARKTGKAKHVPIGETMREYALAAIGPRTSGPIWLDEKGNAWKPGKLSARFRTLKTRLGLNPRLVLYSLRHWKGTTTTRKHGIHAAQQILGHTDIGTTQRYAHPSNEDKKRWQE